MNDGSNNRLPSSLTLAILKRFPIDAGVSLVFSPLCFVIVLIAESLSLSIPRLMYVPPVLWIAVQRAREMSTIRRNQLELIPTGAAEIPTPILGVLHGFITATSCGVGCWIAIWYAASV